MWGRNSTWIKEKCKDPAGSSRRGFASTKNTQSWRMKIWLPGGPPADLNRALTEPPCLSRVPSQAREGLFETTLPRTPMKLFSVAPLAFLPVFLSVRAAAQEARDHPAPDRPHLEREAPRSERDALERRIRQLERRVATLQRRLERAGVQQSPREARERDAVGRVRGEPGRRFESGRDGERDRLGKRVRRAERNQRAERGDERARRSHPDRARRGERRARGRAADRLRAGRSASRPRGRSGPAGQVPDALRERLRRLDPARRRALLGRLRERRADALRRAALGGRRAARLREWLRARGSAPLRAQARRGAAPRPRFRPFDRLEAKRKAAGKRDVGQRKSAKKTAKHKAEKNESRKRKARGRKSAEQKAPALESVEESRGREQWSRGEARREGGEHAPGRRR